MKQLITGEYCLAGDNHLKVIYLGFLNGKHLCVDIEGDEAYYRRENYFVHTWDVCIPIAEKNVNKQLVVGEYCLAGHYYLERIYLGCFNGNHLCVEEEWEDAYNRGDNYVSCTWDTCIPIPITSYIASKKTVISESWKSLWESSFKEINSTWLDDQELCNKKDRE